MVTEAQVGDAMMLENAGLIASTREDLQKSAQAYLQALYGPGILTDWILIGEFLGSDSDALMLYLGLSGNMSSWKLKGMIHTAARQVYEITS